MTIEFEEIGEGSLYLNGNGQGTSKYYSDPIVKANRPGPDRGIDTCHLSKYDGTEFYQWYGRKADGMFWPFGKILRIKEAQDK